MIKYFYTDGKEKFGPYSQDDLKNQPITRKTKVWSYGMDKWTEISQVPELRIVVKSIPPEINVNLKSEKQNLNKSGKRPFGAAKGHHRLPRDGWKSRCLARWLIGISCILLISATVYMLYQSRVEGDIYKQIVANSYESDEDFGMYVKKFYRDLEFHGIYPQKPKVQIIKFSKLDELQETTHIHGVSFGYGDDDRIEIYINPSTWDQFSKPKRYLLMYHELAHDVLNLDDLEPIARNRGELMYPAISTYESMNMDDFIESVHRQFEQEME